MGNNIIKLPGKIDVSLVEGGQLIFVVNLTYDSTNSSTDDGLFLYLPDKTAGEIESAINNNNTVVYLQYPYVLEVFNLLWIDNQLVPIDNLMKSKPFWDVENLCAYTLIWNYDSEADIAESTNSFSLLPAASFDVDVQTTGFQIINHDYIIAGIYYDYSSKKFVAQECELNIDDNCVEALSSSNKAYLLGHEVFEDFSPAVVNSAAYMLNGKLYSNSTEVATQTDISTVTAVAEGKTKSYVTNKTKMSALNSLNDTVSISSFVDLNNTIIALSNFKVGDIVYLTDTEIPDRWVSSITKSGNTVTGLTLSKMETSKVDLDSYVPKTRTIAGVDLQDDITASELKTALSLNNVVNTGDSATPVSGGTTKFTTGGAYTELAKKQDIISDLATIRSNASAGAAKVSANNGTLTLKKGNTTLGTFSANASANTTINIPDKLEEFDSGQVSTDATFTYRTTAGENREIDDGVAKIEKLKGNAVVWNQMMSLSYWSSPSSTLSALSDGWNVVATSNMVQANTSASSYNIKWTKNHKYLHAFVLANNNAPFSSENNKSQCIAMTSGVQQRVYFFATAGWNKFIFTYTGDNITNGGKNQYQIYSDGTQGFSVDILYPMLFDLTLMFGAGNEPSTVEAFEQWLDANVGLQSYYPYDAGSLIPVKDTTLKTVGFNQWDEEWENGDYDSSNGAKVDNPNRYRSVNPIKVFPNTTYYWKQSSKPYKRLFFFDKNKKFISYLNGATNMEFTTPNDCYYLHILQDGTTYENDLCINLSDATKNGTYEAYWENNLNIPITTLQGRVLTNGVAGGSPVVMFPDGLNGKGTCYDEIDLKLGTAVRRYGKVHLKDVVASVYSNNGHYYCVTSVISDLKVNCQATALSTLQCGYDGNQIFYGAYGIGYRANEKNLNIALASEPTTKAAFESALDGVYLYYELDTPVEYELEDYTSEIEYKVDNNGTEEIISDYANPTLSIKYNVNAVDSIRNLPDVYVSAVEGQKFNSALKAIARNNIGLGTLATKSSLIADDIPSITTDKISDFPTIPSVGTGTLTIQKAGTTVATFGANATSNVTANIPNEITTITLTYDSINSSPNNGSFIYTPDISSSTMSTLLLNNAPIRVQASYVSSVFNLLWVNDVLVFLSKRGNGCITTELFYDIDYDYMFLFVYDDETNVFTLEPIPGINNYSVVQSSTSGLRLEVVQSMPANPDSNTIYIVQ